MDPLLHMALRSFIAIIFAAAIIHKLSDWRRFEGVVRNFEIAPAAAAPAIAVAVIALEAVVLGVLMAGPARLAGLFAAGIFTFYGGLLLLSILRGRRAIDCGCSWVSSATLTSAYVYRNAGLAFTALFLAAPASARELTVFDYVNAAGFAAVIAGAYFLLDAILHMKTLGGAR